MDDIVLNFNKSSIHIINVTLAFIMFGIALDLSVEKFRKVLKNPKPLILGLVSQLILLPLFTFVLILIMQPSPSIALGMILIGSCPGGNISNFISSISRADVALSIGLTTITSLLSVLFTPLNFAFYGSLYAPAESILKSIEINWLEVIGTIAQIIIIPIILGIIFKSKYPTKAQKVGKILERISMFLFLLIVVGALFSNFEYFLECISAIFLIVLLHNTGALTIGYSLARIFGLKLKQQKTLTIETGIQNSGLGLLIIFGYFNGLGGMALIAAWWGVWHIVSGFSIAYYWRR